MNIRQQRDFLIKIAYWAIIAAAVYLCFQYLLPISVPFLLGIAIACLVVRLTRKLGCNHKLLRILISLLIYGIMGAAVTLLGAEIIALVGKIIKWVPEVYALKIQPFTTLLYEWSMETIQMLSPTLISALEVLLESLFSALRNLVSTLSKATVSVVSGIATGVPSLILSLLAMIFSTMFLVSDYERITSFASENMPAGVKNILHRIRHYLTDTLLVVIRSYALIMLLTFSELSVLFTLFGISNAVLKALFIALLDILPILGTGGVMIPWAVISLALGNTSLCVRLLIIYVIVTVVRNYVEPKIVGTQLGLHPIITLAAMFIGLRLFGFWGLFGLPVGISFLWKQKLEKDAAANQSQEPPENP